VIALLLLLVQTPDALPAHPSEISAPALRSYRVPAPKRAALPGGAELLVIEDSSLPLVDGTLVFRVGSIHDPSDKAGLAILAADCLREGGSATSSAASFDAWLDLRAATMELLPAEETLTIRFSCAAEDLFSLLERIIDLLRHPALSAETLEHAKQRARTLLAREEDNAGSLADAALLQIAYGASSPWARRPTPSSVESVGPADLQSWHTNHIGPNRLVAGLTGDVSAISLAEHLSTLLEGWPEVPDPEPIAAPVFNVPARTTIYIHDRPGLPQTELRFAGPGLRRLHPDYAPLLLWSHIVGIGGATNRMVVRLRTELGLAYSVGAYFRPGWEHSGRLIGYIATRNAAAGRALKAMVEVLSASTDPFATREFSDALERHRNAEVFRVDTPREVLDRALLLVLHDYPEDFWDKNWSRLATLDTDEVAAAARRHIDAERLIVVAVGPAEELTQQLAAFGEVIRLDHAPTASDSSEWLKRLFMAVGSREHWSAAEGAEYISEMTGISVGSPTTRSHIWISFSDASSRSQTKIAGSDTTMVIGPDGGWARTPTTLRDFPLETCASVRARTRTKLYSVLHELAAGTVSELNLDGEGGLTGTLPNGERFTLAVDESARPVALTIHTAGRDQTTRYSEWTRAGEVEFAKRSTTTGETPLERHLSGFSLHAEMDSELFERP
jgi:zinc protease